MSSSQAKLVIEEKMDTIEEVLEELVLDAVISTLIKVSERKHVFAKMYQPFKCYRIDCKQRDDIPF